jgi:hypothetical protein
VYFSAVPSEDWLVGVDARPSSPRHLASPKASEDNSDILGEGDEDERAAYVREKRKGKQLADEESSPKRKKSSGPSRSEERPVTIGVAAPHRRR